LRDQALTPEEIAQICSLYQGGDEIEEEYGEHETNDEGDKGAPLNMGSTMPPGRSSRCPSDEDAAVSRASLCSEGDLLIPKRRLSREEFSEESLSRALRKGLQRHMLFDFGLSGLMPRCFPTS